MSFKNDFKREPIIRTSSYKNVRVHENINRIEEPEEKFGKLKKWQKHIIKVLKGEIYA